MIFSLVVAVIGFIMAAQGGNPLLIILGLGMAAYSWLTTPRQFLLYRDSMVIVYGMPRTRVISFAEISHVELLAMPMGERLRIRMVAGSRLMLMMRDPGAFRGHLEDALTRYHGEQTGTAFVEGTVLNRGDEPEFEFDEETGVGAEVGSESWAEPETDSPETDSASNSEFEETQPAESETYTRRVEEASSASGSYPDSGSYSEAPPPDYSGEGRPAYDASVDLETGRPEDEPPERPRSPY